MSNKMISFLHFGKTQQIERQVVNNFDLDMEEVKVLLDELRNDFFDRLKMTEGNITESMAEQISRTIECKFIEIICKVNEMPSVTEEKVKQAVQQGFYMLRENSDAYLSDLQNQFNEIKDRELSLEENLTNLCNQIAWQSDEAFNSLFEMVAPLKNIKWDFSYELREGWSCLKRADFNHAKELFTKATVQKDVMAEAYFGLALADCKIQILWDYKNCHEQPLCYDYSIEFSENPNYKLALKNASETQKDEYINFKGEIEHIQKEFEYLENSGLDYDCFICVKISAENGEKTEDSKDADNIYHLLQRRGHKPFYSDYEIRNKKGAEYEAHILYALYKSKCMLLVCRDKEYLKTPWVKNEYMRFLKMIDDGEKKRDSLVIVFYGKKIERLPGRTGRLEGIDFSKRGSEFEIVEFVDQQTQKEMERLKAETAAEAARLAKEQRKAEEARKAEEQRKAEAARKAEEQRKAEEARKVEGQRKAEEARKAEEQRKAEEARKAEETPRAGETQKRGGRDNPHDSFDLLPSLQDEIKEIYQSIPKSERAVYENSSSHSDYSRIINEKIIYKAMFDGQPWLWEIKLGSSVEEIDEDAFFGCKRLIRVIIPKNVKIIKANAFAYCSPHMKIYCEASQKPNGWDKDWNPDNCPVVWDCKQIENERTSRLDPDYPTLENYDKTQFEIEGTTLKKYLKRDFVREVKIPRGLTSIELAAFSGCSGLTSITIPESVTAIEPEAFSGCSGLTSITIPESVTSIGFSAFEGCSGLTSIMIPNRVKSIDGWTFSDCSGLTSITIPNGVRSIGDWTFHGCSGLTSITIPNSMRSIGISAFSDCSGLTSITIPNGVRSIGNWTFHGCSGLTSITIPNSMRSIGIGAFRGCSGLTSIIIPESVTSICGWAFYGCKKLKIYCEASEQPSGWNENWNLDNRPVVWGFKK